MAVRSSARKRQPGKKPVRHEIRTFAKSAYQQAILDAAESVFARLGYHQAKMTDVAAQAGVSIGTLYNHFGKKELIFNSLVERGTQQIASELASVATTPDPEERLRALVSTLLAFIEQHGEMFAVYRQVGALSESDIARIAGKHTEQSYVDALDLFARTIREAAEQGRIRSDLPARTIAASLAGQMNAVIFDWIRSGRTESLQDRADVILRLFMEGAHAR